MEWSGIIYDIKHFAVHDGPGIRSTVFFKGCPLTCWWCHNPESHIYQPQKCGDQEFGKEMSVAEVVADIEKDRIFYDDSEGGITISGGEPLSQPEFLERLLISLKDLEFHITVDTSGYAPREIVKKVAPYVDLFLFDIKFISPDLHERYTGISNELILSNLELLCTLGIPIIIRFPYIPTINDSKDELIKIRDYLLNLKTIHLIDILPYHKIGAHKYAKLGRSYKMDGIEEPSPESLQQAKHFFEKAGYSVKIGG